MITDNPDAINIIQKVNSLVFIISILPIYGILFLDNQCLITTPLSSFYHIMYILYTSNILKSISSSYHIVYPDTHVLVNMYNEECSDGDK